MLQTGEVEMSGKAILELAFLVVFIGGGILNAHEYNGYMAFIYGFISYAQFQEFVKELFKRDKSVN